MKGLFLGPLGVVELDSSAFSQFYHLELALSLTSSCTLT